MRRKLHSIISAAAVLAEGSVALSAISAAANSVPGLSISPATIDLALIQRLGFLRKLLEGEKVGNKKRKVVAKDKPLPLHLKEPPAPVKLPAPVDLGQFNEPSPWDLDEEENDLVFDCSIEAGACRALLLEILRRASYDWVLYRNSFKLQNKLLAEEAYNWLFEEKNEGTQWEDRTRNGKMLTSFLSICEILELCPDKVRTRVRQMTERDIMNAGRPAERRKIKNDDTISSEEYSVMDIDIDSIPNYDPMFSTDE